MIFPFKFSIYQHTNFLNFSLLLFFLIFILSLIPLGKEASQWLVGLGSQLGLAHECRNWKGARIVRQRNPEKSERHKLGLTWVENKMERNGSGSTRRGQKAWGCGYRGWVEKLRAIKAQPPAEPWIDPTVLNPPFPCISVGEALPPHAGWAEEAEEVCLLFLCYLKRSQRSVQNPMAAAQMMTHWGVTVMPHDRVYCAGGIVLISFLW